MKLSPKERSSHPWWISSLLLFLSTFLGTGWCWQYHADARATREEQRHLRDQIAAKSSEVDSLIGQYIRLRDTADFRRDWSARAIAIGMRSRIITLLDDRDDRE